MARSSASEQRAAPSSTSIRPGFTGQGKNNSNGHASRIIRELRQGGQFDSEKEKALPSFEVRVSSQSGFPRSTIAVSAPYRPQKVTFLKIFSYGVDGADGTLGGLDFGG